MISGEEFLAHIKEVLSKPDEITFDDSKLPKDISVADGKYFLSLIYKATKAGESDAKKTVAIKILTTATSKTKKSSIINPLLSSKLWKMFCDQHRLYYRNNQEPVDPNYSENYYILLDHMLETFKQELGLDNDNTETPFSKYWRAVKMRPADKNKTFTNLVILATNLQPEKLETIAKFKNELKNYSTSGDYNNRIRTLCDAYVKKTEKFPFFTKSEGISAIDCFQAKKEFFNVSEKDFYFGDCNDKDYDILRDVVNLEEKRNSLSVPTGTRNVRVIEKEMSPKKEMSLKQVSPSNHPVQELKVESRPSQILGRENRQERQELIPPKIEVWEEPKVQTALLQEIKDVSKTIPVEPVRASFKPVYQKTEEVGSNVKQMTELPYQNERLVNLENRNPPKMNLRTELPKVNMMNLESNQKNIAEFEEYRLSNLRKPEANEQRNFLIATKVPDLKTTNTKYAIFSEQPTRALAPKSFIKDPILDELSQDYPHAESIHKSNVLRNQPEAEIIKQYKTPQPVTIKENSPVQTSKRVHFESEVSPFRLIKFELKQSRIDQITEMKFPDIKRFKSFCFVKEGKLFENDTIKIGVGAFKQNSPQFEKSLILQCFYDVLPNKIVKIALFQISSGEYKLSSHPDENYVEMTVNDFFQNGKYPVLKIDQRDSAYAVNSKEIQVFIPITKFMFFLPKSNQLLNLKPDSNFKQLNSDFYILDHNYFKSAREILYVLKGFQSRREEQEIFGDFEVIGLKYVLSMVITLDGQGEFKIDLFFNKLESESKVKAFLNEFLVLLIDPTTL